MRLRKYERTILKRAKELNIQNPAIYKKRGNHPRLIGTFLGHPIKYPYPGSPSDYRSLKNNLSQLKRFLKQLEQKLQEQNLVAA